MNNIDKLVLLEQKPKTSHILHLLLSVVTGGIWLPIWLIVAMVNQQKCTNIDRKIKKAG
jgi:hypothetical protein